MADLFVYDLNDNLVGKHIIDFNPISGEDLKMAKNRCRDFLTKLFKINLFDKDSKFSLHRKFGEIEYSIILKISDKQITREMILTNIFNND
jgi:hypothetical protein